MIHSLRLYFEDFWHDEALDKSSLTRLSEKKFFLGNMGPVCLKITQQTA